MKQILLAAAALAILGCGGDSTTPDPSQVVVGNYALTQVNTKAVPMVYVDDVTGKLEILSGSMVLRSDHSYNQTLSVRFTPPGGSSQTSPILEDGTFTANTDQIIFTIPASGGAPALSYSGQVAGSVVTYTYQLDTYRFEKQ